MKKNKPFYKEYFLLDANIIIRLLIMSSIIWEAGAGLLGPILVVFIIDFIPGATVAVIGVATSIYLITKSLLQIPVSTAIDRIKGDIDDYWILIIGSFLGASLPLLYLIIDSPIELYFVQFLSGLLSAMTYPSWYKMFSSHTDKNKTGREWGVYFTLADFVAAVTASLGGMLAQTIGFRPLIVIVVIISLIGVGVRTFLKPYLK